MTRYGLNAEELFIIELLLLANSELRHSEYLCKYLEASKCDLRSILVSLQNKNIILKSYKVPDKGATFDPETVPFSKNFLTGHMKCSNELGYEFWRTYPSICVINGVEAPLKNFAKKFNSEDEFFFAYGKSIGWNIDKHREILELVKWAKENNCRLINMNIADFVVSKMWESVAEMKDGDGTITFDTLTSV